MDPELLAVLQCPSCRSDEQTIEDHRDFLVCTRCSERFEVRDGIPLLVPRSSALASSLERELPPKPFLGATSAERQREYWESDLGHRAADHPVVAAFARQRWQHLARLLPLETLTSALDVGAGNGFSSRYAPEHLRVTATDGSFRMLAGHAGTRRLLSDAKTLPFKSKTFDLAYCWELLHHVDEPYLALAEMARVARKYVYIFEPNPFNAAQFLFALADREHRWVLRYSPAYVRRQFELAGLELIVHETVGLMFPNKTPTPIFPLLTKLPFRIPGVGISHLAVARVRSTSRTAAAS